MDFIKVKSMGQTVTLDGKTYGPSSAPLLVPVDLANALGLVPVGEEAEAEVVSSDTAVLATLTTERDGLKGSLGALLSLLGPSAQKGESPDVVLKRVLEERDELKGQVADFPAKVEKLTFAMSDQGRSYKAQIDSLTTERDAAQAALSKASTEGGDALAQVATLSDEIQRLKGEQAGREGEWNKQRDGLLIDLDKALKNALPSDALDRLEGVNGISKALAQKALDALTAPAQPAEQK